MPSFHIDLYSGRGRSEVDWLNGAIVRYGEKAGIPTPVNKVLTETLQALTKGEIPLETYNRQPEKFLSLMFLIHSRCFVHKLAITYESIKSNL